MKVLGLILALLSLIAFLYVLGKIGNAERTDEIIRSMDENTYNKIQDSLRIHGEYPSDEQVAKFYLENY